jgi:hypothetical protein
MLKVCRNILFCYSRIPSFTNAVRDYSRAFGDYSEHKIHYFDMDSGPLDFDIEPFDCIIFNYCYWARGAPALSNLRERVINFTGLKIAILQDEYDNLINHERTLIDLGINTIVTVVPEAYWHDVFRDEAFRQVDFINVLTGYVPDSLLRLQQPKSLASRPWLIGYRSRPVPFGYGRLPQEKQIIGKRMKEICSERGIPANIEITEESRIYGADWAEFIGNCRTVLGTESGANVFDFDGTLRASVNEYIKLYPDADFESVHERFLKEHDGRIQMNQVSPRIFEAIAMKTGLVLFEGDYSGVVRPWEHFIPVKKDFSNIDEVIAAVSDLPSLEAMIQRAYDEIVVSGKYHYRAFIQRIDAHISAKIPECKGYEPCFGLIGWRVHADTTLQGLPEPNLHLPTDRPLRHFDKISDPFITIRCNWGAPHRALMRRYEAFLLSETGQSIQKRLKGNRIVFAIVRKCARMITFRW